MTRTYVIAGATWVAYVPIDIEQLSMEQIKLEACTRAVEAFLKKRSDIEVIPTGFTKNQEELSEADEMHKALIELMTTELEPGCGIGTVLCIIDKEPLEGVESEWFVNSKLVLENVGESRLVNVFTEKYPYRKESSI